MYWGIKKLRSCFQERSFLIFERIGRGIGTPQSAASAVQANRSRIPENSPGEMVSPGAIRPPGAQSMRRISVAQ